MSAARPAPGAPRVPDLERARLCVWLLIAALAALLPGAPGEPAPFVLRAAGEGCRLVVQSPTGALPAVAPPLDERPCDCAALHGSQRLLLGFPIPLNAARASDLAALPGLGPARAAEIVADRSQRGPFGSVEELARVRGVGPRSVERWRAQLLVGEPDRACGP